MAAGDLAARADDPFLGDGDPLGAQRVAEAAQAFHGGDVVEATDMGDPAVALVEEEPGRRTAPGAFGGDDGGQGVVLGDAVGEDGVGAVQALGDTDAAQGEGGVDDAVHAPVEELGDRRVLLGRVAAGVDGQDEVLAVPGGLHGAAQQPAGEGRGGDLVGDQADHGRTAAAQAAGDGVGAVAELGGGLADAFLGGGREVALGAAVEHEGDGGVRDTGEPRDVP